MDFNECGRALKWKAVLSLTIMLDFPRYPVYTYTGTCVNLSGEKFLHFNRCLNGQCSAAFSHYFQASDSTATRGSSERLLRIPFYRGSLGRSTIQWLVAVYWNQLPSVLRTEKNLVAFRKSYYLCCHLFMYSFFYLFSIASS